MSGRAGTRRLLLILAAAGALAGPAAGRGLSIEDVLSAEALGRRAITPDGRWLLVERRRAYRETPRFDLGPYAEHLGTSLMVAELDGDPQLQPALAADAVGGFEMGPVSPDSQRVAVIRWRGARRELGVLTLATGQTRWTSLAPDLSERGRTVAWAGPGRLVVLASPQDLGPLELRVQRPQLKASEAYDAAARGLATATVLGSGPHLAAGRRDPPGRLYLADASGGAPTAIADGAFVDLEVSPDGRRVALFEAGEDLGLEAAGPAQGARGTETRRLRLALLELGKPGRIVRPCPACDMLGQLLSWAPDSASLLAFARGPDETWAAGRLLRVSADGAVTDLTRGAISAVVLNRPSTVRAGWLGDLPIVYGRAAGATGRADWFAVGASPRNLTAAAPAPPADGLAIDGRNLIFAAGGQVWRVDARGRTRRVALAQPRAAAPAAARLAMRFERGAADRSALLVWAGPASSRSLTAVTAVGVRTVAQGPEAPVEIAHPTAGAAIRLQGPGFEESLAWRNMRTPSAPLAALNARLGGVAVPVVRPVRHTGPRGETLTSWLLLSAERGAHPPPLVVLPYPGRAYGQPPDLFALREGGEAQRAAVLTGQGFAVLIPSLPSDPGAGGPGVGLARRLLDIVDVAAAGAGAGEPGFDPSRLALWGFSFGGYGALAVATETSRFRAVIAQAPITDLFSKHGDTAPLSLAWPEAGLSQAWTAGWTEDLQGDMRAPPWRAPERYLRNSPALRADRIESPVLLLHGDLDTIPIGQSEEMFTALFRQGKDARFVAYLGESHVFASPGNIRHAYAEALAWLACHLGDPTAASAAPAHCPGHSPASAAPTPPPGPRG